MSREARQKPSLERLQAIRDLPNKPSRVPYVYSRGCNVFCHYTAGSDYDVVADGNWQNGRICSDRDSISDGRISPQLLLATRGAAGLEEIVYEHRSVRYETVVSDGN